MTTTRERKAAACCAVFRRNLNGSLEDLTWDQMAPVGRDFGNPDFDRLVEEDFRNRAGVFDPSLTESDAGLQAHEKSPGPQRGPTRSAGYLAAFWGTREGSHF